MRNLIAIYIYNRTVTQIKIRRDVFQAIVDPVRREIIELLVEEKLSVNIVARNFLISHPAISKHIKILTECAIVEIEKDGRKRYCKIQPKNLIPAFLWIEQYQKLWESKLDSFEKYLIKLQTNKKDE